jgi:hypothetical protein
MTSTEPIVILFDDAKLRKLTAADMTEFYNANDQLNFRKMASFFTRVVAKCPESWGPISDPKTFAQRPYLTEYREIIRQFVSAAEDLESGAIDKDEKPLAVTFDFTRLTGEEATDFFEAGRTRNYVLMARMFAKVVKHCPPHWGPADQPKTYFKRPYFSEFVRLVKLFSGQLSDESKNS